MNSYVIRGGKEGKERLSLLSQVMLPFTSQFLHRVGLDRGMQCLDLGCGGGDVTFLIANMVGLKGKVIGIDCDREILELTRQDAEVLQLNNVKFRWGDALNLQEEETFDLVYARFLLTHLPQPEKCIEGMIEACKPQGAIAIEDIDFTGSFCYPNCAAYERYTELYQTVVYRRGGEPNIGSKLFLMLRQAGVEEIQINVVQPTHIKGEGKLISSITMEKIARAIVAEGLATQDEIDGIIEELNNFAANPNTLMSLPRIVQVWGRRA